MSFTIYAQLAPDRAIFAGGVHTCPHLAAAAAAGHAVIEHPRGKKYEEVVMAENPIRETRVGPVSVRNHTAAEFDFIRRGLERLPGAFLDEFARHYTGIVCVSWTGPEWHRGRPGHDTLLSGGANIRRTITRDGVTESGQRIELTHSAMYELRDPPHDRRGVFTLFHELGHFAYNRRFTPRTVEREYGESQSHGPGESPAYAFMWYFLDPSRLARADRAAFDGIFGGAGPAASPPAAADPLAQRIHQSVGLGGKNAISDVRVVQKLLNRHTPSSLAPLAVNGVCDALMIERIRWFQETQMRLRRPDSRVDPGGQTLRALAE